MNDYGPMMKSTATLMDIIDVLQTERDAYRAYAGAIIKNMFLLHTDAAERNLAIEHGMLERYVVSESDKFIPDNRKPGDKAFRFTALGIAALENL